MSDDGRWSPETNAARSKALKGKGKSLVTRARMHASKLIPRELDPKLWERLYKARLQELKARKQALDLLKEVA